jgi:PAS domain S-box-containing protein
MGMVDPFALLGPLRDAAGVLVDMRWLEVNSAAATYLLRKPEHVVGRSLREVVSEGVAHAILDVATPVADRGVPASLVDFAVSSVRRSGETRMFDVRAWPVEGGLVGFTWRDVTDRHRAGEARQSAEAQYRLLADNAGDVVVTGDYATGLVTYVSPSVREVTGWEPDDLVGHRLRELVHPDDLAVAAVDYDQLASASGVTRVRVRLRCRDGTYLWAEGVNRPVRDESGAVTAVVASFRDIQAEVEARQAADVAARRLRMVAENATDVVSRPGPTGPRGGSHRRSRTPWAGRPMNCWARRFWT